MRRRELLIVGDAGFAVEQGLVCQRGFHRGNKREHRRMHPLGRAVQPALLGLGEAQVKVVADAVG